MKRFYRIRNGKKGGRPESDKYITTFVIPDFDTIILTEKQYNNLLERYGNALLKKALIILNNWLKTKPAGVKYKGKNNYALFRSDGWLINTARTTEFE